LTARDARGVAERRPCSPPTHAFGPKLTRAAFFADWARSGDTLEAFARSRGLVPQRLAVDASVDIDAAICGS